MVIDGMGQNQSLNQLVLEARDATTGRFLGETTIPIALDKSCKGLLNGRRLMLAPRMVVSPPASSIERAQSRGSTAAACSAADRYCAEDMRALAECTEDDFGWVLLRKCDVRLVPCGGLCCLVRSPPVTYPVGCSVKAAWLCTKSIATAGIECFTVVRIGDQRYVAPAQSPLHVRLEHAAQVLHFEVICRNTSEQRDVLFGTTFVTLPAEAAALDREIWSCCPIVPESGVSEDLGVVIVCLRLWSSPPDGTGEKTGPVREWGRPNPDCPATLRGPVLWESDEDTSRAGERRWRRSCVVEAKPVAGALSTFDGRNPQARPAR